MINFIRKNYRLIIPSVLLLLSFYGMTRFKMLGEQSESAVYDIYFLVFQIIFILSLAYVVFSWLFSVWKEYRLLKNKQTEAELAILKNKIDPHFFFNTLNNLYGLVVEKSEKAPEVILKLSDIMRYTIYEGEKSKVSLADEIAYLEQYIEIHKIRYQKNVKIDFEVETDKENTYFLAPLLLIILVENAFKHGIEKLRDNAFIDIKLYVRNHKLHFKTTNNFDPNIKNDSTGIGLRNFKRRLELIYPKKHEFNVFTEDDIYKTGLILDLEQ
ncbi:sensor histidine kinase [Leptobacterium flavescens]|uniref:Sensor histidine kinase n=1 Tax=Leptobacterium flavescens TaxID=472055 RepID=A0A6P0UJS6_9FLAO|nr:histidine kinase [Leptobacterium flavescens]NER13621.1 sensor histidine kinase [Leptobacterium flavescens]